MIDDFEGLTVQEVAEGKHEVTVAFNGRTVVLHCENPKVEYDGRDELESIWRFGKPARNGEHPTMKPISLCARAIQHGSKKCGVVADGFLGSGSTLIACEQTKRVCYGTELDPVYCDVIVKRWENLTGKKAELHGNSRHKNDRKSRSRKVADKA